MLAEITHMGTNSKKGDRRERELVNKLHADGFAVMRAPASGAATKRELPDVLAGNGIILYAIESKTAAGGYIYIDESEIDDLCFFAEKFGAEARIAVRFDREDWFFFHPNDMYTTKSGNKRIKKENITDGIHYSEFLYNSNNSNK